MRILYIQSRLDESGGAETYFDGLMSIMGGKNEVAVASFGTNQKIDFSLDESPRVFRHLASKSFSSRTYISLKRAIRTFQPDIIHIATNDKYPFSILLACIDYPTVFTTHNYFPVCSSSKGFYDNYTKRCSCARGIGIKCLRCVSPWKFLLIYLHRKTHYHLSRKTIDVFISPSRAFLPFLKKNGYKNVSYVPLFSSVDCRKKMEKTHDLLFVGRLNEEKGIFHLIRALKIVACARPSTRLLVVGDGPDEKKMKSVASRLGVLDMIDFKGKVPHEMIGQIYRSTRITLVPSLYADQCPLVGIESLTCGTPCIGFDSGGIREWLRDGENGLLLKNRTPEALAKAILSLLEDEALLEKFSNNAKNRYFTKENHLKGLEKAYMSAINIHNRRTGGFLRS